MERIEHSCDGRRLREDQEVAAREAPHRPAPLGCSFPFLLIRVPESEVGVGTLRPTGGHGHPFSEVGQGQPDLLGFDPGVRSDVQEHVSQLGVIPPSGPGREHAVPVSESGEHLVQPERPQRS
jgi:hypothetical protein